MPATAAWDETQPLGSAPAATLDTIIQELKRDIRQRMELEHHWNESVSADGYHRLGGNGDSILATQIFGGG